MPAHLHPPTHSIIYTHPSQERKTPRSSCHADFVSEKKTVKVWERRKKIKYIISASLCVGYTYIQDKTSPIIIRWRRRNHRSIPLFPPLRRPHHNLLPLHALPLHKRRAENRHRRRRHRHVERLRQRGIVRHQHAIYEALFDLVLDFRGAHREHDRRVEIRDDGFKVGEQGVGEDVLADGDEQGAAQRLRKHDDGGPDGDVLFRQGRLHRDEHLLHAEADACAEDELVADPFRGRGVGFEGGEEPRADGHEDGGYEHERGVVSYCGHGATGNHGDDDEAEDGGEIHDAGFCGADALDGLEPDGEVVHHYEESGAQHGAEPGGAPDVAVFKHARGDRGVFLLPDLDREEADDEEAGDDQQGDDAAALPGVLGAAPLEGEQQADDGGEEEGCAFEIEFADLLREGGVDLGGLPLDGEEGDDEGGSYGAEGEVDVEAPAPGEVVGEGAAEAGRC